MQGEKSKSMSSEDSAKGGKDMKAEGRDSKTGTTTTESRDSKTGDTQTKGAASTDSKSQTTGNAATSATAAPPAEKRTQIVSAIRSEKIQETTNVNFNISVGAVVPTSGALPPASAPDRRDLSGVARLSGDPGERPLRHRPSADA